ncbi:hypothetical protein QQS21_003655 [Conoideocrella luteorostrata]|uniref:Uncharacterized protein n=1 Tax=Conoideocrella luteorostrata TaxID=1105319 RepID=A0AAJ0G0F0_9HYPO|nr:hypothetical protein QQS21_003655 [Conoideocrella luteorostrata]
MKCAIVSALALVSSLAVAAPAERTALDKPSYEANSLSSGHDTVMGGEGGGIEMRTDDYSKYPSYCFVEMGMDGDLPERVPECLDENGQPVWKSKKPKKPTSANK